MNLLPIELQDYIWEYDDTKYRLHNDCIRELDFIISLRGIMPSIHDFMDLTNESITMEFKKTSRYRPCSSK